MSKTLMNYFGLLLILSLLISCSAKDSAPSGLTSGANAEAVFGTTLNSALPAGLKSGASSSDASSDISSDAFIDASIDNTLKTVKDLTGTCLSDYTSCPYITATGGWDYTSGEILSKLWAIDYNNQCTSAYLTDGTCFQLTGGNSYSTYIKPTVLSSPSECATMSSSNIKALNFGIDPCMFDNKVANIQNYSTCKSLAGTSFDISALVPWYSSWNIPQTVKFSGFSGTAGAGMYWTISNDDSKKYFISIDSNWLYGGIKDDVGKKFFFFGSGSPSYYDSIGEGSGMNLSAYSGDIPVNGVLGNVQIIQVRSQGSNKYIIRQMINSTHVWFQYWNTNFPTTPAAAALIKDTPDSNRCLQIGANVSLSKYVPFSDCVTAFSKTSVTELNQDSNFELKVIDEQTLNAVNFSTRFVSSDSACL
ncbi:MAG: hypothetical protein HQK49_05775 [Oligoflexia bacterium]|nr:hypothetical protein [Oligoflexia bacterium]